MNNKRLRIAALVVLVVVVLGMIYGRRILGWRNQRSDHVTALISSGERKVLYYYDAMNPQHHYDKPGKAPDGMDLVPQYAEDSATRNGAAHTTPESANSATPGERKVLYWYDPMHPAYKSDKPGIAPDCGMTLVPKYAEDRSMANMPMGTVTITPEKQVLAGVRTAVVERKSLVRDIRTTAQIVAD